MPDQLSLPPVESHGHIRRFVRETLGCSCPDEVVDDIRCARGSAGDPQWTVRVGGRLLIHIISCDGEQGLPGKVQAALEQGVSERDRGGFNRFRLVLAAARPEQVRDVAGQAFSDSPCRDEKTHLHVLDRAALPLSMSGED